MNGILTQFAYSFEHKPVTIRAVATGTGASAPVLQRWKGSDAGPGALAAAGSNGFHGVVSIARNGAGDYTFTFKDRFQRFLGMDACVVSLDGATAPLAGRAWIKSINPNPTGGATVRIVTYLATPGTGVDLGTNDQLYVAFYFEDSTAP